MPRRPRIAYLRISQETNALSTVPTTLEDFHNTHYKEGAALGRACGPLGVEVEKLLRRGELSGFVRAARGADLVPLLSAWAIPGGPLTAAAFETLRDRALHGLRAAGPLDGVFVALHGAMGAEGRLDPDGDLLAAIRAEVGPEVRVATTLDLHAQLTPTMVDSADILLAYRTNPHRDHFAIGRAAGELLMGTLAGTLRPTSAWRTLPLLVGGGKTIDLLAPMRGLFRKMRRLERTPGVLACNLFMCHLWCDHPDLGWAVHVVTDGDAARAEALADELAEDAWALRNEQPPTFLEPGEAIAIARDSALHRRAGAVCMSDTSDVVAAGAPGGNTALVQALLEQASPMRTYAPLRDPAAVDALWDLPEGAPVDRPVGGTIDPDRNTPIQLRGRIGRRTVGVPHGRCVVVDADHLHLVLTEGPPIVMKPAFYADVGLDPWRAEIMVVKSFFHWRIYFLPIVRRALYVRTRGVTDIDAAYRLDLRDPVHPRDVVTDWRATDARRRGGRS